MVGSLIFVSLGMPVQLGSHPQARMKTTTFDVTNLVYHRALLIKIDTGSVVVVCLGFWAVLLSNYHKDWTKAGHRCNAFC